MKYGYTILYVPDVLKTVSFYEEAFGMKRLFVHDSNGYAEMETGSTRLAFTAIDFAKAGGLDFGQLKKNDSFPPIEIDLVTKEVKVDYAKAVKAGAKEVLKPVQKPWGQTVGYVQDCNGFLVAICSPLD